MRRTGLLPPVALENLMQDEVDIVKKQATWPRNQSNMMCKEPGATHGGLEKSFWGSLPNAPALSGPFERESLRVRMFLTSVPQLLRFE